LFRDVARRCHPDANPSGGDLASTLWHAANDAYRTGDLPRLRTVALLSRAVPDGGIATEELRQRRRDLLDALSRLQAEIDDILTSFPLSLRPLLEDPEWLKAQQNAAMERLASLEDCRLLLEAELAVLIRESSDV